MDEPLYLIRAELDMARLMALGSRRRLPMRETDLGYLVHCLNGEVFGEAGPKPFAAQEGRGRSLVVLGYSVKDANTLARDAETFADPSTYNIVDWSRLESKRMPQKWEPRQRLGFEVRVCPVVRKAGEGPTHRKGAEVDAFLARCWEVGKDTLVDREEVYRSWLSAQFDRSGGARVLKSSMIGFERERLVRRTQGSERRASVSERPDVRFKGELEVTDPVKFQAFLRRGVGRHRGFGFGMLLLRRSC